MFLASGLKPQTNCDLFADVSRISQLASSGLLKLIRPDFHLNLISNVDFIFSPKSRARLRCTWYASQRGHFPLTSRVPCFVCLARTIKRELRRRGFLASADEARFVTHSRSRHRCDSSLPVTAKNSSRSPAGGSVEGYSLLRCSYTYTVRIHNAKLRNEETENGKGRKGPALQPPSPKRGPFCLFLFGRTEFG